MDRVEDVDAEPTYERGPFADLRVGATYLLSIASALVMLSGVAYAGYVADASFIPAGYNNLFLGQGLTVLAGTASTAGFLALASVLLLWFVLQGRPIDEVWGLRTVAWIAVALGLLVFASGLAGIAGAALSSTAPRGTSDWETLQQVAVAVGTAALGVAVTFSAIWSLRTYFDAGPGKTLNHQASD